VRRLFPDPGETSPAEQLQDLKLSSEAGEERPYVVCNFAMTLDGRATIAGRSGPIGSAVDTEMLQRLRTQTDAVMIGASTMRVERYGRLVEDAELRGHRERIGLRTPDPLAVLISNSLQLPWDAGLFTAGYGRVVIFTTSEADPPETATSVRCVRMDGDGVVLLDALRWLRQERGVRSLLCEGGPRTMAQLAAAGICDELFLTIAPKLAGGDAPRITEGELGKVVEAQLVWLLESDGELFTRYRL
jgi:riboflavin-specific deaminase-like protein